MFEFPIDYPDSIMILADWIELRVTANESSVSKTELKTTLERVRGEEPDETFISDIWSELTRRKILYGEPPPFELLNTRITSNLKWKRNPEYLTCLLLAYFGNKTFIQRMGKLFERLSCEAVKRYLQSNAIIRGFPNGINLNKIMELLGERINRLPPKNSKDRGVDIFAWKSFEDGRANKITILIQCAAGNNWKLKTKDVSIDAWCRYVDWGCRPMKGFCIPRIIEQEMFEDISPDAGLIIDRPRIFRNTLKVRFCDDLRTELKGWCVNKLENYLVR